MLEHPQKQRNIIFIPGITTTKWMTQKWESELTKKFPTDKIHIINTFYIHTQKEKIDEVIRKVEEILKTNKDATIIGHSFGGIIALATYFKNIDDSRNNIKKILTIATPHSMETFNLKEAKEHLGYRNIDLENVEIQTFGGLLDSMVPNKFTKIEFKEHASFFCGHNGFLLSKRIIRKIIKESLK